MNIFCEAGWRELWDTATAASVLKTIKLYQNNYVPTLTDTVGSYTEATFSGYVSQTLAWGAAFINGSTQAEIDATALTWTHSAGATGNTVYGIYVLDNAGALVYAERFPAPISMTANGDAITYTPKATMINQ